MRERSLGDLDRVATPLTRAGFTAAAHQWQAALFAFLRGLLDDAEQARDLTQDTFHDAWRATQAVSPPWTAAHDDDERRRWLFHTAYCRAISQLRRRKVIRWASLDWSGPRERGAGEASIGAFAEQAESFEERVAESEALRAALARLRPDDVACLLLRVAQGFSAAEVADMLGISVEAVGQRLSRARRRLRTIYLEQNPMDAVSVGAGGERSGGDE